MAWILLALLSALSTSVTTISSKLGLKEVNSNFATLVKTSIVIVFSFILCLFTGAFHFLSSFTALNWIYLTCSGLATGCSWICYFKALQLGDVNKVVPIDKSSFILTSLFFLIFFFPETTKDGDLATIIALASSLVLMLIGTLLMIEKKSDGQKKKSDWYLFFAILSSVFASLVALFGKLGLNGVDSNLATFYKTIIVFLFALAIILVKKDYKGAKRISKKGWICLSLSGIATGLAWIAEFAAYATKGSNAIAINSIGKLSILITMLFSFFFLKEHFSIKSLIGLGLLVVSISLIIVFSL